MALFSDRVTIIAEVGSNHDGDLARAAAHIDAAAACGADIVKFQSFLADEMVAPGSEHYDMLSQLQMPEAWYPELMAHCASRGVKFLSTATNFTSLGWMEAHGAVGYKVASGNITHRPLIDRLIAIGKPVIVSTGLATLEEIVALARHLRAGGLSDIAFLHCVSKYPTPPEAMRLKNISVLRNILDCRIGFSDHSEGAHLAVAAVALGARVVEKHFSLDKSGLSPDHDVSMPPDDFARMCAAIRETEQGLFADFTPDRDGIRQMRRSLHFSRDLRAGDTVAEADIKVTRPEDGLLPAALDSVLGRRLARDVSADDPVRGDAFGDAA